MARIIKLPDQKKANQLYIKKSSKSMIPPGEIPKKQLTACMDYGKDKIPH
jgi:hypothetical protein